MGNELHRAKSEIAKSYKSPLIAKSKSLNSSRNIIIPKTVGNYTPRDSPREFKTEILTESENLRLKKYHRKRYHAKHLVVSECYENTLILQKYLVTSGVSAENVSTLFSLGELLDFLSLLSSSESDDKGSTIIASSTTPITTPIVVWLDVNTPETIEKIPHLREILLEIRKDSLLVCLSSYADVNSLRECHISGSTFVFPKPFSIGDIVDVLELSY